MNLLQEGDVIELKEGDRVYADIPEHFLYANRRGSWKMAHGDIRLNKNVDHLYGVYIVEHTARNGGGRNFDGDFPDGHHVYCRKESDPSIKVDFYQTGCFTAMIPPDAIKPIGRAVKKWTRKEGV